MKRILISATLLLLFSVNSCYSAAKVDDELVYLKPVSGTASSFDSSIDWAPKPDPDAPIDGNLETRWSSELGMEKQWIYFDFGVAKVINQIIIHWETAYAVDYEISISDDTVNWKTIATLAGQDGKIDEINLDEPVKAQYVRIQGLKRFNDDWGISIWEFECYGSQADNLEDKPLALVYPGREKGITEAEEGPVEITEVPYPAFSKNEFQGGAILTSWDAEELASNKARKTLLYLHEQGYTHISIPVTAYQDDLSATGIYPDPEDTPSISSLTSIINDAHKLGIRVMLKPHVDLKSGQFRGKILPSEKWFKGYEGFILSYANLAERTKCEYFIIGTELEMATHPEWEASWRELIKKIRNIYKGSLVYAANWTEYIYVGFFDDLDYIGIDAYFPLSQKLDPTKAELDQTWGDVAQRLDEWRSIKELNIPIILTEIGYVSTDGANIEPWASVQTTADIKEDQQEQADCFDAAFNALSQYDWFQGTYIWNYFPRSDLGVFGFTPRGKQAEEVISEWNEKLR